MALLLEETAYAKINLYLHVTGKRQDGYHLLDSLAVFAEIGDHLTVQAASSDQQELVSLRIKGPFAEALQQTNYSENLIIRAALKLVEKTKKDLPQVGIVLEKNLPVASGIGGGSSDAAAAIRLLQRYWNLTLSETEQMELATQLGADVAVCLTSKPQKMEGIGEILSADFHLPKFGMVLVNHGEAVSTAEVFKKRQFKSFAQPLISPIGSNFDSFIEMLTHCGNDLQEAACQISPVIEQVLQSIKSLPGCRLSRMSGSGATCFGIFDTVEMAQKAAGLLSKQSDWWVWGGRAINE